MICNKDDLKRYLQADKYALEMKRKYPIPLTDYEHTQIWRFEIALRYHEYYHNVCPQKSGLLKYLYRLLCNFWGWRQNRLGMLMGFTVPINVFAEGLRINHFGSLIVNCNARIGKFCDVHSCVNIGNNGGWNDVPEIGDNVWIGPGAKIFGKIRIGDNCVIGANAVVNKSIPENVTVAGVPAKVISNKGTKSIRSLSEAASYQKNID